MFSRVERMLAFRYLRTRRKEGFISVITFFSFIGIALGVATLIVVMAVMNGFRAELMDRILGINAHLSVTATGGISEYDALSTRLGGLPGVTLAAPMVQGEALATASGRHAGAVVRGMYREDFLRKSLVSESIVRGNAWTETEDPRDAEIVIGRGMAAQLGVVPGDVIQLISPQLTDTVFGSLPRIKDYRISGIFDVGMGEYDGAFIFMPIEAAQLYFQQQGSATAIELELSQLDDLDSITELVLATAGPEYRTINWQEANRHFFNSLKVERNVMFLILTLIILVAAFNIISGMVMLVTDKQREIAVLRTMGATKGMVMRVFLLAGAVIGFFGTLLGFLLGLGFAANIESIRQWLEGLSGAELFSEEIYFLSQLPAVVMPQDVALVVGISLLLSFLATLYPAWRAARILPAEALRYE